MKKDLLQKISRSFALSLFSLPKPQRDEVGLTYLLARVADTIADSGQCPAETRLKSLQELEAALEGQKFSPPHMKDLSEDEARLLQHSAEITEAFRSELSLVSFEHSKLLVKELIAHMEDLIRLSVHRKAGEVIDVCKTSEEFDRYCYGHAGCVGQYWTRMFDLPSSLEDLGIRYGKALERVNILRDVVADSAAGRMILARDDLRRFGLGGAAPWKQPAWRDFCFHYVKETQPFLEAATVYCNSIPKSRWRLRWASMMPLQIAKKSLALYLSFSDELRLEPLKITRPEVRSLAAQTAAKVMLFQNLGSPPFQSLVGSRAS